MEGVTVDRRVRKTKKQLRIALMQLMHEKSIKSISVRELAERADINRGTFYIHYKDVNDLLQQIEDELAEAAKAICKKYSTLSVDQHKSFPFLEEMFQLILDNQELCTTLLDRNGDHSFTDRVCEIIYQDFLYDFVAMYCPEDVVRVKYFCASTSPGFISVALAWLHDGAKETPAEMANLVGSFLMYGLGALGQ